MRRFEHALRLDETPVGEIKINVKSRDDIPALLLGLQHLYVSASCSLSSRDRGIGNSDDTDFCIRIAG